MNSGWWFIVLALGVVALVLLWVLKTPRRVLEFWSSHPVEVKGIVRFTGAGLIVVILTVLGNKAFGYVGEPSSQWFAYGEVFLGIDQTNGQSPQCKDGDVNDRLTSNGGFRVNIWQYRDRYGQLELNGKGTHHSCALNPDRNGYDAIGPELKYRFFER